MSEPTFQHKTVPCHAWLRANSTIDVLNRLADAHRADSWRVRGYFCADCKCEWTDDDVSTMADQLNAVCSNCYSENVAVVKLRLERVNWNE